MASSGNLKKVLEESIVIAKINAHKYLPADKLKEFNEKNVHVHFM